MLESVHLNRRLAADDPKFEPGLARSLHSLVSALDEQGRREEALAVAQDAIDLQHRLAETNPAAFEPELVIQLPQSGQYDEARQGALEAVNLGRRLAKENPDAFESTLARSLWTYAWIQLELGSGLDEAFSTIRESVELFRRLTVRFPAVFTIDLQPALGTAAAVLDALARPEQAQTLRRLTEAQTLDQAADFLARTDL